ncbi:MAG: hypothetical protein LH609_04200 [Rudanella sp.]|nr:hypothetical protein [Rudanella sp.]
MEKRALSLDAPAGATPNKHTKLPRRRSQYFFVVMACLFPVVAFLGFLRSYQEAYSGVFPIHWFAHVHGAIMTAWLGVFLAQTILVSRGNVRLHRQLGQFSVGLGVLVWISMIVGSIRSLISHNLPIDSFMFDVLLAECQGVLLFGVFFTWGMLVRKNVAVHKRLLFLATLILLQAAIDRMHWLPGINSAIYVRYIYMDTLFISLFIYDLFTNRCIHPITWVGASIMLVSQVVVNLTWGLPAWHTFWFDLIN